MPCRVLPFPSFVPCLVRSFAVVALVAFAPACSKDSAPGVTSSTPRCGNGIVESGESCDLTSPGCDACLVRPGWSCDTARCVEIACDGGPCGTTSRATSCSMAGFWAARETNFARDQVVGAVQSSSNWFLIEIAQEGDAFVYRQSLDCGIHVTGSVTVDLSERALRASVHANRMDGVGEDGGVGRPARRGTAVAEGDGCAIRLDRWYKVRGLAESFLPADFASKPDLGSLPPVPTVNDPVNGDESPVGTVDSDGDGIVGLGFRITGFVSGVRNSAQRDWKEFATVPGKPVAKGALRFDVPGTFDLQESVLRVTECGTSCALLKGTAVAATDIPSRIAFAYVGAARGTAEVDAVVGGAPRADLDVDLATCEKVRALLPHEGAN
ncbi:MAG: hypothetical protein U0169_08260 [Polyangiaceae bacterium]